MQNCPCCNLQLPLGNQTSCPQCGHQFHKAAQAAVKQANVNDPGAAPVAAMAGKPRSAKGQSPWQANIDFIMNFFVFRTLISPFLIGIIYFSGAILGSIGLVLYIMEHSEDIAHPVWTAIGAVILANILWRVICELYCILFSIHSRLCSIDDNTRQQESVNRQVNQTED